MSRIANVIGTDRRSALAKSLPMVPLSSCAALASPNSATVNPGWTRCTAATARSTGATRSSALLAAPRM
jgi:hypothetical protein